MSNFFAPPGSRKYFANTSWLQGERVSRMAVSLLVSIYVARYLAQERFGLLSYALSFVPKAIIGSSYLTTKLTKLKAR